MTTAITSTQQRQVVSQQSSRPAIVRSAPTTREPRRTFIATLLKTLSAVAV